MTCSASGPPAAASLRVASTTTSSAVSMTILAASRSTVVMAERLPTAPGPLTSVGAPDDLGQLTYGARVAGHVPWPDLPARGLIMRCNDHPKREAAGLCRSCESDFCSD